MNFIKNKISLILCMLALLCGVEGTFFAAQRHHGKKHAKVKTSVKKSIKRAPSKKAPQPRRVLSRKKPVKRLHPQAREKADIQEAIERSKESEAVDRAKRLSLIEKTKNAIQPQKPVAAPAPAPAAPVIPGATINNVVVDHQNAAECGYNALWNGWKQLREIRGEEQPQRRAQDIEAWKQFIINRRAQAAQDRATWFASPAGQAFAARQAEADRLAAIAAAAKKPAVKKPVAKGKGKAIQRKPIRKPVKKGPVKPAEPKKLVDVWAARVPANGQWIDEGEIAALIREFTDLQPEDYTILNSLDRLNPNNPVGFENIAPVMDAQRANPNASHLFIINNGYERVQPAENPQIGKKVKGAKPAVAKPSPSVGIQVAGHWIAVVVQGADNFWSLDSIAPGRPSAIANQFIRIFRNANPRAFDFAEELPGLIDGVLAAFNDANIEQGLTNLEQIINRAIQSQLFNPPLKQVITGILNGTDDRLNPAGIALLATTQENEELTARINAIRASLANNQPIGGGGILAGVAARVRSALGLGKE